MIISYWVKFIKSREPELIQVKELHELLRVIEQLSYRYQSPIEWLIKE